MLKKLKIGLIVLILFELACFKVPVEKKGDYFSALFKMSVKTKDNSSNSLRLYVTSDCNNFFAINVLLPTNKLVLRAYYNGKSLVIVDYRGKIAYIDSKKPFDLKRVVGYSLNVESFIDFFNLCYLKKKCRVKASGETRIILTESEQIAVMGKFGNILLKPIGRVVKGGIKDTGISVPKGFKVVYERN